MGLKPRSFVRRPVSYAASLTFVLGETMKNLTIIFTILSLAVFTPLVAAEAPSDQREFNVACPAQKLLPVLDGTYHQCNKGFVNGSCEKFVDTFKQLLPEYDCQRSFDATPTKNYIVPAVWLAGDGALEDYTQLLSRMALLKDRMFKQKSFRNATTKARKLFGSKEFRKILDGSLAEEYSPLSTRVENQLKGK